MRRNPKRRILYSISGPGDGRRLHIQSVKVYGDITKNARKLRSLFDGKKIAYTEPVDRSERQEIAEQVLWIWGLHFADYKPEDIVDWTETAGVHEYKLKPHSTTIINKNLKVEAGNTVEFYHILKLN
jgi:hypothetical protein